MTDASVSPPPSKAKVFFRRTASTLFLWGLVTAVFVSSYSWAYLGLMALLTLIATLEYFRMAKGAGIQTFPRFGLLLSGAYCCALHLPLLQGKMPSPYLDAAAIFIVVVGSFTLQLARPIRSIDSLLSVAVSVLGFLYIPFLFNYLARLLFLIPGETTSHLVSSQGAFLILWVLAVTKFTDMGAYITGSLLGRHKMIPHVSPGKTWEGFGGAIFFSQLAACGLFALFPHQLAILGNYTHVISLGFLLSILSVIGDLAESIIKRALNAKDSGQILPGIGGGLDLIDSICFTAPAAYFYIQWVLMPRL